MSGRMFVYLDDEREPDEFNLEEWDWEIEDDDVLVMSRKDDSGGVIYIGYAGFELFDC